MVIIKGICFDAWNVTVMCFIQILVNGCLRGREVEQFLQRYIYSWRLNGWLIHDVFMYRTRHRILLLLFIVMKRKRLVTSSILLIAFLLVSHLLMIVLA